MKQFITLVILGISLSTSAQKLVQNEIDEFTKAKVVVTSWHTFFGTWKNQNFCRVKAIDNNLLLEIRYATGYSCSIDKDDKLYIKLSNDSIITLPSIEFKISMRGDGAINFAGSNVEGINPTYFISPENKILLSTHTIKKARINTSEGYIEHDVSKEAIDNVQAMIQLIDEQGVK